ncbi:MAG: HEAT repeat domain-containing protein [Sedimentisphaerales bacterium]|nr:HEAT repeat domain-containing protein [Sedimentisphaerales bacterium]
MRTFRFVWIVTVLGLLQVCPFGCHRPAAEKESEPSNPLASLIQKLLPEDPAVKRQRLLQYLGSPDPDLRRQGVLELAEGEASGWDVTTDILALMAKGDAEPQVRAAAVQVYARRDASQILPDVLAQAAQDISPLVRREALGALENRRDNKSLTVLLDRLANDSDPAIRSESAKVLAGFRDRRAVAGLIAALEDEEFRVQYRARESLETLTGRAYGYNPSDWENWFYDTSAPFAEPQTTKGD